MDYRRQRCIYWKQGRSQCYGRKGWNNLLRVRLGRREVRGQGGDEALSVFWVFFSVRQRWCMSRMSSGSWTSLLSQEVLGKRSEWFNQTVKQVSHAEGCRRMRSPLLIPATQKQWTEAMHTLLSNEEMEPERLSQHFSFHLAFFFLIFIIVITFKCLTWNGNEINSYHTYFCCRNIVALLTNLWEKRKGYLLRYNTMMSAEAGRRREGTDKFKSAMFSCQLHGWVIFQWRLTS